MENKNIMVIAYNDKIETEDSIYYQTVDKMGIDIEDVDHIIKTKPHLATDCSMMEIDEAISILTKLKENGSKLVEIDYHGGHGSYIFSGLGIRLVTDEELALYTKLEAERAALKLKISSVRSEGKALMEELDALNVKMGD